jgi:hypothetical protein
MASVTSVARHLLAWVRYAAAGVSQPPGPERPARLTYSRDLTAAPRH